MNATTVTCFLDIGRCVLGREFSYYERSMEKFGGIEGPLVVYAEAKHRERLRLLRDPRNTEFINLTREDLRTFPYFDQVQKIRRSDDWLGIAAWIADSPQRSLEYYNPLVMMKPYWLVDVARRNPFGTDRFYWLDGGIFSNDTYAYLGHWMVRGSIPGRKFLLFSNGIKARVEAHGIPIDAFNEYCGTSTLRWWVRGGLFGGRAEEVEEFTESYDAMLEETLGCGHMGTEESILTILAHRHPHRFDRQRLWLNRFSTGVLRLAMGWPT